MSSAVTFGPVGRVVVSLLMLVPLWWFIRYAGPFGLVGVPIWLWQVLPRGMRDIWRPVRLPASEADIIRARAKLLEKASTEPQPGTSINDRAVPSRW